MAMKTKKTDSLFIGLADDLLLRLHPSRFLRLSFRKPRGCGTLAGDEWKDDLHNQKGKMVK